MTNSKSVGSDLFSLSSSPTDDETSVPKDTTSVSLQQESYTAADIEVLEGLEPVRRRPGMYIGGTDTRALHHLFAEVIDNAMDEAVAGHANWIEVKLEEDGSLVVNDNGRGIPVDPHPRFPQKSALEVIMCTLHAGGKFGGKAYETSGGLHGVGVSVVNALSSKLEVEVARGQKLFRQTFSRGAPLSGLESLGAVNNRRGTKIRFSPDPEIFGENCRFDPARLFAMARSKAYLFSGVEIRWFCAASLITDSKAVPEKQVLHFPKGLEDFLTSSVDNSEMVTDLVFSGRVGKQGQHGAVEWAVTWLTRGDPFLRSYCNTVPTAEGGTHEAGLRQALLRGLRGFADLIGNKKSSQISSEDILVSMAGLLSCFIREPEFQGQTKDKLSTSEASRIVDGAVKDAFDHWLTQHPAQAGRLLDWVIEQSELRLRRRKEKEVSRKSATRRLRLPGKLADCSIQDSEGTELFIVEGDSAGGSAKQARNRSNQAVLPLRGKVLNVASSGRDKITQNQQLGDLLQALGCATGNRYSSSDLRYEKIIIMTDADVDGAHIASLLITFFYREMPKLIQTGHLYLAVPPLYRISQGGKTIYAKDDIEKDALVEKLAKGRGRIEISRFKGLGEMMPAQLKETTMDPNKRILLRVEVTDDMEIDTKDVVERLMGSNAEPRFNFIQERAEFAQSLDI